MTAILVLKIAHFFGFVAWFSGLFYLVRMFVYHREAYDLEPPASDIMREQYGLMETRVYTIICNPAMMITWTAGLGMIYLYGWEWFIHSHWIHVKLVLLVGLTAYHLYCKKIIGQLVKSRTTFSSTGYRLFNEVPTLILLLTLSLAVFKNGINYIYLLLSIVLLGILLILLTKLYKLIRESKQNQK